MEALLPQGKRMNPQGLSFVVNFQFASVFEPTFLNGVADEGFGYLTNWYGYSYPNFSAMHYCNYGLAKLH